MSKIHKHRTTKRTRTHKRKTNRRRQRGGMCGIKHSEQMGGGGVPTYGYKDGGLSEVYRGSYAPVSPGNTSDCPDASKLGVPALEAAGRTPQEVQGQSLAGGGRRRRHSRRSRSHRGKKHSKKSRHNRRSRKSRRNRRSRKSRSLQKGGSYHQYLSNTENSHGHRLDLNSRVGGQAERGSYSTCDKQ